MARNQFVDDVLSDKTSLIHLLNSNDDEDNKEAHIIKHPPYYGETDFSNLLVKKPGFSILPCADKTLYFAKFSKCVFLYNPYLTNLFYLVSKDFS